MDTQLFKEIAENWKDSLDSELRMASEIIEELLKENARIEDERQMYITLALRYQKDAEEDGNT